LRPERASATAQAQWFTIGFEARSLLKTLILEHDQLTAELLETMAAGLTVGARAMLSSNIADARQLLDQHDFDLILTDWDLPDGSGLDLVRFVRRDNTRVPIVMMCERSDRQSVLSAAASGVNWYISKPFNVSLVHERLKGLIPHNSSGQAVARVEQLLAGSITSVGQLPTNLDPVSVLELMDRQDSLSPAQLAEIWREEISLIARLLDVANSTSFRRSGEPVKHLKDAIAGLGVPMALNRMGFTNVIHIPEQDVVSGDFPTVVSPNPEEPAAMKLAMEKAAEVDADIVMATDPDADRIGVAVKNDKGEFFIVNGNQTVLLFLYYIITKRKEKGDLVGNEFVVKTIVTSELVAEIARRNDVEYFDCYTGFKYIADVIRENEGVKKYIGGGEESFGFLPADFVRDKDAVSSCALMAEIAAWAKDSGKSLFELLQDIYLEYGFSKERMKYVVRKGKAGAEEIQQMMVNFRENPPKELAGSKVAVVKDYSTLKAKNLLDGSENDIDQKETSNVLQFFTEDGSKVSVRPSGTEPKIKFYIEVKGDLKSREQFDQLDAEANEKVDKVMADMGL